MTIGRPTTYTKETAALICEGLSEGLSLRTVCKQEGMPALSTIFLWLREHKEFSEQYAIAKEESADAMVEDMLDIADNQVDQPLLVDGIPFEMDGKLIMVKDAVSVNHAKLRVDTRKWAASKLKPKKYGERIQQEITGKDGGAIEVADMSDRDKARRIAFLLAKGVRENEQNKE